MKKQIKKIVKKIVWSNVDPEKILKLQIQNNELLYKIFAEQKEVASALKFNSMVSECKWMTYKDFSPGGWAVDFSFLYTLYNVLNQKKFHNIIEFGMGQSSKMIHQYLHAHKNNTKAVTIEHDEEWAEFFMNSLNYELIINYLFVEIGYTEVKGHQTLCYKDLFSKIDGRFDLIIVDAPFGSEHYSRSQILDFIPKHLQDDFCIIIDDSQRFGEKETIEETQNKLKEFNIDFLAVEFGYVKKHFLITSKNNRFLTSL